MEKANGKCHIILVKGLGGLSRLIMGISKVTIWVIGVINLFNKSL